MKAVGVLAGMVGPAAGGGGDGGDGGAARQYIFSHILFTSAQLESWC